MDSITRRRFLVQSSAVAAGLAALRPSLAMGGVTIDTTGNIDGIGYGPLLKDPDGILNLPKGFSYHIISPMGVTMDDGLIVPGKHDGMAAFPYINDDGSVDPDRCVIVRNHEVADYHRVPSAFGPRNERLGLVDPSKIYDAGHGKPLRGGCTTLVYNLKEGKLERHWLSLTGTMHNCSGGPTPWGSWISCEEAMYVKDDRHEKDHGYCFEVPVTTSQSMADPKPIVGMGRFLHEGACVDPGTGIVYMTEDRDDGLLYRFVPDSMPKAVGDLHKGGKLQALRVVGRNVLDTRNHNADLIRVGEPVLCGWVTLDGIDSPDDDLRHRGFASGAARLRGARGCGGGRKQRASRTARTSRAAMAGGSARVRSSSSRPARRVTGSN
ncbi:MAG: DUF839 domain-containing protein [Phycisphaerales bacterium]|nr:DUF839 domain-containing protein [Phycisphaerales bacterium]